MAGLAAVGLVAMFCGVAEPAGAAKRSQKTRRPGACAVPDGLVRARERGVARTEYIKLLKRLAGQRCAIDELRELNKPKPKPKPKLPPSCKAADASFEKGDLAGARAAYEKRARRVKCASAGVVAVKEVEALCGRGDALADIDRDADARKAFDSALEKNPHATCATDGVNDLRQSQLSRLLDGFINSLDKLLVALGLLLAALFLMLMLGYVKPIRRLLFWIPGVRRLLGPRLSLQLDDAAAGGKLAKPMEARIRETLQSFRQRALEDTPLGDYDMDVIPAGERFAITVTGTSVLKAALKQAREVNNHMQVVGALLDLLYAALPIDRFTLVGVLDPAETQLASTTLTLEKDASLAAATKLEGTPRSEAAPPKDYLALSGPAGVWAQYEVVRAMRPSEVEADEGISNALLRQALDCKDAGDEVAATAGLEAAVAANPQNWAAQVLLAIDLATGAGSDYELAIGILEGALIEMAGGLQ